MFDYIETAKSVGTADSGFFSGVMDGTVCNCNKYGRDLVAGAVFPLAKSGIVGVERN